MRSRSPNIVQIVADDLGYGDLSAFNDGRSYTPRLDAFIETGIRFGQHYSGSPVCAPARACLLTGRYPHRTGAIDTRELTGLCNLSLREITVADVLKDAGYATGLVGKWHNGSLGRRFHPNARGFDEFVGFRTAEMDYFEWNIERNGAFERSDGTYLTDFLTEEAEKFIRRHRDEPFFLHLAYNAPHTPIQVPEQEAERFRRTGLYTDAVAKLYGMISRLDRGIGQVLDCIDELGIANNTLVQFTSDNGPDFGGEGQSSKIRYNCGLNGSKFYVFEGGIRVPMIVRWPDGFQSDRTIDDLTHFSDWLPTFAKIADATCPSDRVIDGVNVLPLLQGARPEGERSLFWQWNRYLPLISTNAAVREGAWKAVRPPIPEAHVVLGDDSLLDAAMRPDLSRGFEPIRDYYPDRKLSAPRAPQLFNIEEDPEETIDLSSEDPLRLERMLDRLTSWFEGVESERSEIEVWPDKID